VVQPARQICLASEHAGLAREDNEHRLGDFFRLMWVGGVAERDGMNEMDVAVYQHSECLFALAMGKFCQQLSVIDFAHSTVICAPNAKGDKVFFGKQNA